MLWAVCSSEADEGLRWTFISCCTLPTFDCTLPTAHRPLKDHMKRWKKVLLALFVILVISQLPFAYRRYKLGRLQAAIQRVNSARVMIHDDADLVEYKGVIHVHSFLGGHSSGGFEEIIAAAKSNQLDFVMMTEHTSRSYRTADMTLKGNYDGVLFINGNEVSLPGADRLLLLPGLEDADKTAGARYVPDAPKSDELGKIAAQGRGKDGLTFVAYPQEFRGWDTSFYDGVEVYNLYTNARQINPLVMFFDGLWSYRSYPDLLFANFYRRPAENLQKWDQSITKTGRRLVAVAGNDAHSNIGLALNDSSGKTLVGMKLDPYERSFRLVRVHALLQKDQSLNRESLLAAIGAGHAFIGFDLFGDSSGFSWFASNGSDNKIQGDEIALASAVKLTVNVPVSSRVVLFKDGNVVQDETGITKKDYAVTEKGTYRVEVYLPQLPKPVGEQPWIISNPIYVK